MTTGEKIRELRLSLGMTQEELGELVGVQKGAINKYETGIVVNLKQERIRLLARALHVSPVVLLGSVDELTEEENIIIQKYRLADSGIKSSVRKLLDI